MRLFICRTKRYGGITTFLFDYLEVADVKKEDILILDTEIDENIFKEINEKYPCRILFFPALVNKFHLVLSRMLQGFYIQSLKRKYTDIEKVVYIDWHLLLDWIGLIKTLPIIAFVHTYPTKEIPYKFAKLVKRITKQVQIVTVSNYSAEMIKRNWKINKKSIEVIHNYSNLNGDSRVKKINSKTVNIVTIAHCESYKNPDLWLKVAREITTANNNVTFHWYGDGSLYEEFRNQTLEDKNIFFHGYTNNPEKILNEYTTIYIQTSKVESLGISLLDAMNYSIPCVVTNVGGMPEIIEHKYNGYVCNYEEEIIFCLRKLINNEKEYQAMSKNAKIKYEKHLSRNIWVKKIKGTI